MSWQLIAAEVRAAVPFAVMFVLGTVAIILIRLLAEWEVNAKWQRNLRYHLPEITRDLLEERDRELERLRAELAEAEDERERLRVFRRGVLAWAATAPDVREEEPARELKAVRR